MLHPSKTAVTRELKQLARPAGRLDASRYFRCDANLGFYNVGTQAVDSRPPATFARQEPFVFFPALRAFANDQAHKTTLTESNY